MCVGVRECERARVHGRVGASMHASACARNARNASAQVWERKEKIACACWGNRGNSAYMITGLVGITVCYPAGFVEVKV